MKRIGLFLLANLLVLTTIIIVTTARPERSPGVAGGCGHC